MASLGGRVGHAVDKASDHGGACCAMRMCSCGLFQVWFRFRDGSDCEYGNSGGGSMRSGTERVCYSSELVLTGAEHGPWVLGPGEHITAVEQAAGAVMFLLVRGVVLLTASWLGTPSWALPLRSTLHSEASSA